MKITRENYESFFVDYLDDRLDEALVNEFIEFLQQNKDLKEELLLFENIQLWPENIVFENKNRLLKEHLDSKKEFERSAIACLEGDLAKEDAEKFENYLKRNPDKQKEYNWFEKTRLVPEPVNFPHKNRLYKRPLIRTIFLWTMRAAAIILIAGIISVLINNQQENLNIRDESLVKNEKKFESFPETPAREKNTKKTESVKSPVIEKQAPLPVTKTSSADYRKNTKAGKEESIPEITRDPVEVIPYINPLKAGLSEEPDRLTLAVIIPEKINTEIPSSEEERLLADVIKKKLEEKGFSFTRLTRAGLNLASKLTNEKFTYSTSQTGQVTEYAFESRLLEFSIPAGKK